MATWKTSATIQSKNFNHYKFFGELSLSLSKVKLERVENLVICQHNETKLDASLLKYFVRIKNLYIGESSFESFTEKLPRLDNLGVGWLDFSDDLF